MNRQRARKFISYGILLVIQFVLIRYLSDKQVIATLFSAGAKEHLLPAIGAIGFVVLRLFLCLFVPALVACELFEWALDAKSKAPRS